MKFIIKYISANKFFLPLLIINCLLLSVHLSYSQTPQWQWAKSAGGRNEDVSHRIVVDVTGNSVIIGYFKSDSLFFDYDTLFNPTGQKSFFIAI